MPITSTSSSSASLTTAGDALPRRRVDHLHAGVAAGGGDDAAAAVVAVESDLRDQHARAEVGSVVHAGSLAIGCAARLAFSRPTKRRAIRSGASAAVLAVPGLAPVERAHQHQAQRRCGRSRRASGSACDQAARSASRTSRAAAISSSGDGRCVARPHADHDLRVVGLVEQGRRGGRRRPPRAAATARRAARSRRPPRCRCARRLRGRPRPAAPPWSRSGSTASPAACRPGRRSRAPTRPRSRAARTRAPPRRAGAAAGSMSGARGIGCGGAGEGSAVRIGEVLRRDGHRRFH